ncbi:MULTISPECIES: hypothetical protein [Vibrio harveyi group]|uniref:hypothetical protein n=1 Tax=Vibrio harveyi group TaxID=717610 RepID=UPI0015F75D67|nr:MULTISPECIES: hypothetical protein [Vibrio harveyi group]MDF4635222.1 hypothetical protein [Vibrio parahaemolyticus]MDG2619289.1 hypothetical protein [Vibrio parahaemolyticus]MDV5036893.1 hypothetical protein [Vibrio diabolicus]MDV5062249.1 hypothetical protein [Vibrio diabolicus]HBH7879295.1 hypothetical protein [Vibrio parahaemolyticus]
MTKKALLQILNKAEQTKDAQQLSKEETSQVSGGVKFTASDFGFEDRKLGDISIDDILVKDPIGSDFFGEDWTGNVYRYTS